ncbi:transcriptional regulator [Streptomyces sp. NPDC050738]|uniref:transcriptional regulator n=1 Tax=Streptomyces sp. NPDC050738 TaxID=3154744 RepID=UPI003438EE6B
MPERNLQPGLHGARGVRGSDAVARRLDALAGGIVTLITARRGLMARLHYLTRTNHARAAAKAAGLTVTDRTIKNWLSGKRQPNAASLEKIEAAYRSVRRENVSKHLLKRLNAGGGTRVEIHPLNQSQVDRPRQRVVEYRQMNVRDWGPIVAAWAADDDQGLDAAWTDGVLPDLGSQWGQYEIVTNIGFAA